MTLIGRVVKLKMQPWKERMPPSAGKRASITNRTMSRMPSLPVKMQIEPIEIFNWETAVIEEGEKTKAIIE